tara:strand:- start:122 stop:268 length:147 start_codon:yes stop_codon:yes gene_type:complete
VKKVIAVAAELAKEAIAVEKVTRINCPAVNRCPRWEPVKGPDLIQWLK